MPRTTPWPICRRPRKSWKKSCGSSAKKSAIASWRCSKPAFSGCWPCSSSSTTARSSSTRLPKPTAAAATRPGRCNWPGRKKRSPSRPPRPLRCCAKKGRRVAFPEAVEQMRDDMRIVVTRLERTDVGELTQAIEREIIDALEEMIDALQKEMEKSKDKKNRPTPRPKMASSRIRRSSTSWPSSRCSARCNCGSTTARGGWDGWSKASRPRTDILGQLQNLADRQARIQKATYDMATGRNKCPVRIANTHGWRGKTTDTKKLRRLITNIVVLSLGLPCHAEGPPFAAFTVVAVCLSLAVGPGAGRTDGCRSSAAQERRHHRRPSASSAPPSAGYWLRTRTLEWVAQRVGDRQGPAGRNRQALGPGRRSLLRPRRCST